MRTTNHRRAWLASLLAASLGALSACGGGGASASQAEGGSAPGSPSEASGGSQAGTPASASAIVPVVGSAPPASAVVYGQSGKRPTGAAPLMGMNIGAKNYDDPTYQEQLSRLDIVVLGFHANWRGDKNGEVIRHAVQAIKSHNPKVVVGQYTVLNESYAEKAGSMDDAVIDKLQRQGWWLRNAAGQQVQWTDEYNTWEVNITDFTAPDANGDRYPQWYAQWVDQRYFKTVPEFDFRYFDNFLSHSLVTQGADWKRNGTNLPSEDPEVASAFRRGQMATLTTARRLAPTHRFQLVNLDINTAPEYDGQLNAAYLEGLIGKEWSIATWAGWEGMMARYKTVHDHLATPKVVGFNAWGARGDYRAFRFGLASSLLGNGYYSHTLHDAAYSTVPWFDEYEVPLGKPVDPWPAAAWQNGVWKRRYEQALVLVNPTASPKVVDVGAGWQRFRGQQDPGVNSGAVATTITLPPQDGLILIRKS